LVQHAVQQGITLFDTADIYGGGDSERILGRALREGRDSVTLVTKGGQCFTSAQRIAALAKLPVGFLTKRFAAFRDMVAANRAKPLPRNYTAAYLRRALEQSLRRLGTDYIDIYLLHSPGSTEIQNSDCFAMLEHAKEKGLVRHWGISCEDLSAIEAALRVAGISILEVPLSVLYPVTGPAAVNHFSARNIGLIVGQILTSRNEVVPAAKTPKERIDLALKHANAAAIVGTTSAQHLNEAIV
jgi:aryl-alcohol dehydrogenase-like predicted oxidoreductase